MVLIKEVFTAFRKALAATAVLGTLVFAAEPAPAAPPAGAGEEAPVAAAEAIRSVLVEDSRLGGERNQAPKTRPLADAIRAYVAGLDALAFEGCPEDFIAAFRTHREAWAAAIPFLEGFAELRGELHALFDRIRARDAETGEKLKALEAQIWGTWGEVEASAGRHGVETSTVAHD